MKTLYKSLKLWKNSLVPVRNHALGNRNIIFSILTYNSVNDGVHWENQNQATAHSCLSHDKTLNEILSSTKRILTIKSATKSSVHIFPLKLRHDGSSTFNQYWFSKEIWHFFLDIVHIILLHLVIDDVV